MYRTAYSTRPSQGEVNNKPSVTVPGEAYTIPELLRKFSNGQSVSVARNPSYSNPSDFDSPDLVEIANSDFVDKEMLANANQFKIQELYENSKKSTKPATASIVDTTGNTEP